LGALGLLSQVGVVIFMFVVGMGVDLEHIREKAHAAVLVSHASIVVPFFLGAAFSLFIYRASAPSNISFTAFALFMSVAMSITAFPVLARIIEERGLSKSYLGTTAIACAAVDDVTAWCILAIVIATVGTAGLASALLTILLTLIFIALMLFVLKPRAARLVADDFEADARGSGLLALVLMFVFASALVTEGIGIHALFGAFLAGVVMPPHAGLRKLLTERLGGFTSCFLLPLFFAFTGLRTQVGLLNDWSSWLTCAGIIAVAIAGKLGGSMLAAYWTGMNWHDSLSLGILMNTRGMVELIVLNIGYDLGILGPRIFSMMVIMAITTTFMTGPLLSLPGYWQRRGAAPGGAADLVT
jgi:Kef-type K+ transport system membrane component KefB